ncbi:hypothetical protein K3F43_19875 [Pseudomonas tussilaginis]|uniref:hypothetical protein n=1 Tax=unclassified Pseudomonas TaxID=196821 RepID=UPI000C6E2F6A|nr:MULTISPECIES: hypothetical protein [unclassified Pseudomonas]QYX46929.1 hypothetical protein K3F43_19875 [Pseudomonas sp. S11A 273]
MGKDNERLEVDLEELMKAGEPLMAQAVAALRRYQEAQGELPAEKVESLRLEAEALFTAVNEYQRQALGDPPPRFH